MITKVIMPEMGEGVTEGTIVQWLVQEGDFVKQYAPLVEVETDKVTTEITTEEAGTVLKLLAAEGDVVEVGAALAFIGEPGDALPENGDGTAVQSETPIAAEPPAQPPLPMAATAPAAETPPVPSPPHSLTPSPPQRYTGRISPVVGRIAAEYDVDLNLVTGTGLNGRITKKDLLTYIEQRDKAPAVPATPPPQPKPTPEPLPTPIPPAPPPPHSPALPAAAGEVVPLTNMRRRIAEHMVQSKHTSPHVTTVFEVDFTAVAAHRAAHKSQFSRDGANLTFTAYIVAATAEALKQHPMANSSWAENGIELKREINIGMAAATEEGLIVPVIKNADSLNLLGLARVINDLTQRARSKQLSLDDIQGGTFTITNHGTSGSLFATPIINQPQCGILGIGKIEKRVKVIDDAIAIRPLAFVSFTFDHRILDGATADYFVAAFKEIIESWR
ncbi:MAG TPA: 2-oxo acid dehydrogenase subunit E2 [Chloroflexi bacterium]|nr:2-oxo acid dehydrogenase subunit E2 [Chloroflexota bacterium]